ncbi:hypothetical protein [Cryobacterium sp. 10C3]|uniref:hypothetical protein n=1 Tax=Cryobacterium sp. 10C3 TaxID=3048577 RepID=UPI002AB58BA6|nr:hypothetical protein [Cryobacterium sp. 10C3]MDY7555981.1 hypothetical protein [Cryobacterium sp. 10C3]
MAAMLTRSVVLAVEVLHGSDPLGGGEETLRGRIVDGGVGGCRHRDDPPDLGVELHEVDQRADELLGRGAEPQSLGAVPCDVEQGLQHAVDLRCCPGQDLGHDVGIALRNEGQTDGAGVVVRRRSLQDLGGIDGELRQHGRAQVSLGLQLGGIRSGRGGEGRELRAVDRRSGAHAGGHRAGAEHVEQVLVIELASGTHMGNDG